MAVASALALTGACTLALADTYALTLDLTLFLEDQPGSIFLPFPSLEHGSNFVSSLGSSLCSSFSWSSRIGFISGSIYHLVNTKYNNHINKPCCICIFLVVIVHVALCVLVKISYIVLIGSYLGKTPHPPTNSSSISHAIWHVQWLPKSIGRQPMAIWITTSLELSLRKGLDKAI